MRSHILVLIIGIFVGSSSTYVLLRMMSSRQNLQTPLADVTETESSELQQSNPLAAPEPVPELPSDVSTAADGAGEYAETLQEVVPESPGESMTPIAAPPLADAEQAAEVESQTFDLPAEPAVAAVIPTPFSTVTQTESNYGLLVDKSSQRLFVYRSGSMGEPVRIFRCSTGKNKGDKQEVGDRRTPVGIYYMTEIKEDADLPDRYGIRAFVTDYPNIFDHIEGKNGYGIWLHATDEPDREKLPNITDGCVVINNEDIRDVSQYIALNKTPLMIINQAEDLHAPIAPLEEHTLEAWRSAWESRDMNAYMDYYSGDFQVKDGRKNFSKNGWRRHKEELNTKYSWLKIRLEYISVIQMGYEAVTNFRQEYQSNQFSDTGYKRLYWRNESGTWRIVREAWYDLEDNDPLLAAQQKER